MNSSLVMLYKYIFHRTKLLNYHNIVVSKKFTVKAELLFYTNRTIKNINNEFITIYLNTYTAINHSFTS